MTTPVNRSNFLYYFFNLHSKSKELSKEDKKMIQIVHCVLGCLTPGIGHAILGIAYAIQKCCKAPKTNQVAQKILQPEKTTIQEVKESDEITLRQFEEPLLACIERFDHEAGLKNLLSLETETVIDGYSILCPYGVDEKTRTKEWIIEYLQTYLKRTLKVEDAPKDMTLILTLKSIVRFDKQGVSRVAIRVKKSEFHGKAGPTYDLLDPNHKLPSHINF